MKLLFQWFIMMVVMRALFRAVWLLANSLLTLTVAFRYNQLGTNQSVLLYLRAYFSLSPQLCVQDYHIISASLPLKN